MLHAAVAPSLPPTAVTFSVSGRFSSSLPPDTNEIVVVRQNHLSLYRSHRDSDTPPKRHTKPSSYSEEEEEVDVATEPVLDLVAEVSLHAPPLAAAVCKPLASTAAVHAWRSAAANVDSSRGGGGSANVDVLVLLFDDFHVSFLQFDALRLEFETIGLVQLDDRDTKMERCALNPIMRVDPTGSYVAVLVRRRQLFVFPVQQRIRKDMAVAHAEDGSDAAKGSAGPQESSVAAGTIAGKQSEKKAKVALDAWGDDDDGEGDSEGENGEKTGNDAAREGSGQNSAPSEPVKGEQAAVASSAQNQVCAVNDEVLQFGTISQLLLADLKPAPLNVRDFQFVETAGGDPLFAFLYEKDPTWAGRVKLVEWRSRTVESNMLTCSILWIKWNSANTPKPKPLTIGDVDNLPFNLTHLVPLPAFEQVPSAVLCMGQNTVVHVSVKNGFGTYINANGKEEVHATRSSAVVYDAMKWASSAQERSTNLVKTNLSFANAVVVVSRARDAAGAGGGGGADDSGVPLSLLVITEKEGTVVELALRAGGYTVASMESRIVRTGCFASCWAELDARAEKAPRQQQRYFLGSVCGDSRAVRWVPDRTFDILQSFVGLGPVQDADVVDCTQRAQRRRATSAAGASASTAAGIAGEGMGDGLDPSVENSPFADLFHNVSIDPEPQTPMRERRAVMDLALCSASGSEGSLSVLRQSIRNDVIRREEVNAVSVFFMENKKAARGGGSKRKRPRDDQDGGDGGNSFANASPAARDSNAHLIMTGNRFTILFAIRSDSVQQVRGTVLNISARTVFAAELDWAPALLQVTETEMYLCSLDGKRTLNHVAFPAALPAEATVFGNVKAAFLLSPLQGLAVHFEHGQVVLFQSLLGHSVGEEENGAAASEGGDSRASVKTSLLLESVKAVVLWAAQHALLAVQGDDLVLFDLSTRTVTSRFPNFAVLPAVALEGVAAPKMKLPERLNKTPFPVVSHIHVFDHPPAMATSSDGTIAAARGVATVTLITTSGELLTYRVFPKDAAGPRRLLKSVHHLLDLQPEREKVETIAEKKRRLHEERASLEKDTLTMRETSERLVPFHGIGGYEGVYVCGQHPVFLIFDNERNELVATRHQTAGAVRGFSPFHSRHVDGGYVYCCEGYVYFASMQLFGQSMGKGWWMQRVPLGVTPHRVVYSAAAHSCFVVTSSPHPFSLKKASFDVQLKFTYDEEGRRSTTVEYPMSLPPLSAATTGAPVPLNDQYEVRFFSCADWSCTDTFRLEENEKVLSAQCIAIPRDTSMDAQERSAMGPVCVLATAFPLGEDVTTRGRLLLLGSRHADGEKRLRLLHSEALKGPATAVTGIEGNIAVAIGGTIRVYKYDYRTQKLETMALLYAGAYVTRLSAFRNFLIFGDLFHSAALARFSADNHTLTVLGKDVNLFSVVEADMLYHGGTFGVVVSDDARNVAVMGYTPRLQEVAEEPVNANANQRRPPQQQKKRQPKLLESVLTIDGEYRLAGGCLLKLLRFRSPHSSSSPAVYVTNYGEVGFLVPLSEQANLTSQFAARGLQRHVPPAAGLPPRMFLGFRQDDAKYAMRAKEKLMHAPLLEDLFRLDTRQRKAVSADASTQLERVLNVGVTINTEAALF